MITMPVFGLCEVTREKPAQAEEHGHYTARPLQAFFCKASLLHFIGNYSLLLYFSDCRESVELTVDQLLVSHLIKYISFQPAYNFHPESSGIHQPAAVRVGEGAV